MRALVILFCLIFPALILSSAPVYADMSAAQRAYAQGQWEEAARMAAAEGGVDGYAFAAGARLAQLMVEPEHPDRRYLVEESLRFARYAYREDEDDSLARLRLAGAIGYQGRFMGGWRAYMQRLPQRGRRLLESVVEEDPRDAWALGMLGAWHLEVARRGGDTGLRVLDASIESGIGYYSQAIALDPVNPAPRYFLALGLTALGEPAYLPMAREQVLLALSLAPRDAFEAGIRAEAERLAGVIDQPDMAEDWANDRMTR